jgi:predicted nucleotidyltransferase
MMTAEVIVHSLRSDIQFFLPGARVLLFGSRSKGDYERGQDFDILIITKEDLTPKEKIEIETTINKVLVKRYHMPFDILVYSQSEVEAKQDQKSILLFHALKEAVEI